jgi:hypothetical protein
MKIDTHVKEKELVLNQKDKNLLLFKNDSITLQMTDRDLKKKEETEEVPEDRRQFNVVMYLSPIEALAMRDTLNTLLKDA